MVLVFVMVLCGGRSAVLAGEIVAWGSNSDGQCDVPEPNEGFIAVAAGYYHSLGLKEDGSIMAWGDNDYGQCDVPEPNEGFIAVAAGGAHNLGIKADGSIAAWGWNEYGQCNVPEPNAGFIAVVAGTAHSLGLKADGSIAAWGYNEYGQCDVPEPNEGFIAVAAGELHSLGLKDDGSIAAWGHNNYGQCDVPEPNEGFIAVAAGEAHSLGLKDDGSIAAWGRNSGGQCDVPLPNEGFIVVAAGELHSLGIKAESESMGTAFTYQGRLLDANSAADGLYDFQFALYDSEDTQHGNTVEANDLDVIDGYFTVELDFGSDAFDGFARWLEIGVRPGELEDPNVYTTLSPRQEVTPTPYSLHAKTADSIAAGGETDPTVLASVKDGVDWSEVTSIPAGFSDDIDNVGLTSETDPQVGAISNNYVPKWDGSALVTGTIYDDVNVGIGTTTPRVKLSLGTDLTSKKLALYDGFNDFYGLGMASQRMTIFTSSTEKMTIHQNGNVGIGTTSPTEKLEVNGTVKAAALVGDGSGLTNLPLQTETDPTVLASVKDGVSWTEVTSRPAGLDDGDDNTQLSEAQVDAYVADNGYLTSETDPQVSAISNNYVPKWDGSALVTGTIYDDGNVGIGTTSPRVKLSLGTDLTLQKLALFDGLNDFYGLGMASGRIAILTNSTEKMTIHQNGNVGIGTTTPDATLQVDGTMKVFGLRVTYRNGQQPTENSIVVGPYTALTDGFVVSRLAIDDLATIVCYIQGVAGSTVYATAAVNAWPGQDYPIKHNSFTMPVRKGETWYVEYTRTSGSTHAYMWVYWMPLGM